MASGGIRQMHLDRRLLRRLGIAAALVIVAAAGVGAGYLAWGRTTDWYAGHDAAALPASPENDLIRYGHTIVVDTATTIGRSATNPDLRYAGNDLACTNCHINAGLKPFAAPFVSTFATYPQMDNDRLTSLADRLNGCMTRSMNGKPLPKDGREMQALIAYIRYVGTGSPLGVRVPGMGLKPVPEGTTKPDADRGRTVFLAVCAKCHGEGGQGQAKTTGPGYTIPPLWGTDTFNAGAGMAYLDTAAAFIHANMPPTEAAGDSPVLTAEQAWDVAAFVIAQPRPPAPPASGD
jgi:thiosulfate dehydrogenase